MAILTKEQILQADDLKKESVKVKEWGGEVIVRTMTGIERDAYEKSLYDPMKPEGQQFNSVNLRARLVALTVIDENGNRLFTEEEALLVGKKSASALERVYRVALRLNALDNNELEDTIKK
jgi:hypothetical protein